MRRKERKIALLYDRFTTGRSTNQENIASVSFIISLAPIRLLIAFITNTVVRLVAVFFIVPLPHFSSRLSAALF